MLPTITRELDKTKIDWQTFPWCSSAQMVRGVYPEGTTKSEVEAKVIGTFGGIFHRFENGEFTYLAYTD